MKSRKSHLILFCHLLIVNVCAHQDTTLKIHENKIIGLPEKYENVSLKWESSELLVNGKALKFPDFISGVLNSNRSVGDNGNIEFEVGVRWKLNITASWSTNGQEDRQLPDYLIFNFYPENKDYFISIAFDLEKPAMVGATVVLTTFSKPDGDKWINSNKKVSDTLVSTEMEVVIQIDADSIWETYGK